MTTDNLDKLAELPCLKCDGTKVMPCECVFDSQIPHNFDKCDDCHGTGAKYPMLRQEKEGIWSHRDCKGMGCCQNLLADGEPVQVIVTDCQGRGYTVKRDLDALAAAVVKAEEERDAT